MGGKAYFNVLKEVASSLDFLMPQYYNGYVRSYTNFPGALSHYTTIANEMFNDDVNGEWSKPMRAQLALDSNNCSDREEERTDTPVVTPTNAPVVDPTNAPVVDPTAA